MKLFALQGILAGFAFLVLTIQPLVMSASRYLQQDNYLAWTLLHLVPVITIWRIYSSKKLENRPFLFITLLLFAPITSAYIVRFFF